MRFTREQLLLYAVTDTSWLAGRSLEQDVEQALQGGVTLVQLREKQLPLDAFIQKAVSIKALCARYHVPFIVNDSIEVALASDADGIHVGQTDASVETVRKAVGPHKVLGVSTQTVEQAVAAEAAGADYLGVGAVFSTTTKEDASTVSLATLKQIVAAVAIPVCAIGGISRENLEQLKGTGIDGVALVSAIFAQEAICAATEDLLVRARRLFQA